MDTRRQEQVEAWESRSVSGLGDLRGLADDGFSGVVRAADATAFLLNGRVVGVQGGDVSAFEGADATAHEAPHPSLPLLFAMQESGGETQARYYSEDTPLDEVDDTLSEANFTGYVELSENVLSGDYYLVYHAGNRMCVAFVGASEELKTGQEAYDLTADEVGIYEVVRVDVDVQDVPEPSGGTAAAAAAEESSGEDDGAGEPPADDADQEAESADDGTERPDDGADPERAADAGDPGQSVTADRPSGAEEPDQSPTADGTVRDRAETTPDADADGGEAGDPFREEAAWRETVSIPAVAPGNSSGGGAAAAEPAPSGESEPSTADAGADRDGSAPSTGRTELEDALEERTAALEEARERLAAVTAERDELAAERDDLRAERDELRERVADLEAEIESLREGSAADGDGGGDAAGGESLDPETALSGTDLFVRSGSRGDPTLDDVPEGASREGVQANLRLDHHTQFDDEAVRVDGEPYDSFLRDAVEYEFVEWLIGELPFEIRETGHESALRDLYEALPEVDRAELHGTVEFETGEGTGSRTFDVVVRDRMGNALVVADLNDRRDPVDAEMMSELVDAASAVAGDVDLAGAFYVTSSFFRPAALETATDATGGGFLSRDKRESYVKTNRKRGFHLCLVETRDGSFYLNVPEL